jgi:hypothetical protein
MKVCGIETGRTMVRELSKMSIAFRMRQSETAESIGGSFDMPEIPG